MQDLSRSSSELNKAFHRGQRAAGEAEGEGTAEGEGGEAPAQGMDTD